MSTIQSSFLVSAEEITITRFVRQRLLKLIGYGLLLCQTVTISASAVAQQMMENRPASSIETKSVTANDTRYRIGAGDVLTIVVRKAPELSGTVRVDQRGMIRLAMIEGEVRAACRTESELASEIAILYLEYKKNPSVDVFVSEFQSRPVAVIGAINAPGQFRLQRQVRLLELLSFAGGPANRAGRIINVIHTGGPSLCPTTSDEKVAAPLQELAAYRLDDTLKGQESANPFVLPGDIVSIPEADQVFIIGQVMSPQALSLRDKPITISRAIAMTGGPQRTASTKRIRIIRQAGEGARKQEIFVDLQAVLKQKAEDIVLIPNDIVDVPSSTGKTILSALTGAIAPMLTQVPVRMIP